MYKEVGKKKKVWLEEAAGDSSWEGVIPEAGQCSKTKTSFPETTG